VAELKTLTGYSKLDVRLSPPALKKSISELKIDLSAIAKGYAVDQVGTAIRELDFSRYLVEVGGEVTVSGERSGGGNWIVAIEEPDTDSGQRSASGPRKVSLKDLAIATSGDYRNFHEHEGRRYSHTIDPTTCRPVDHSLTSASIAANDCMTADAWATAAMVMGTEKAHKIAADNGVSILTLTGSDHQYDQKITGDYPLVTVVWFARNPSAIVRFPMHPCSRRRSPTNAACLRTLRDSPQTKPTVGAEGNLNDVNHPN